MMATFFRFMSYLLYELGEALQAGGDVLADAGDLCEVIEPKARMTAKAAMERMTGAAWTAASVVSGVMACCLALAYRGAATLAGAVKRWGPSVLAGIQCGTLQTIRAGKAGAATFYRAGQRARQSMAAAWSFRAAILAEGQA